MNSCNTDIFFSNYYHLQSVRFEFITFLNDEFALVLCVCQEFVVNGKR